MSKLYYCKDCKRVFNTEDKCIYCGNNNIKELKVGNPVSIIESKKKGKILKILDSNVILILSDEMNNKYLENYNISDLRKIL